MKKTSIYLIAGALTLFATACNSKKETKLKRNADSRNAPLAVQGFIVKTSTLNKTIEVPGSLLPFEATELHPEVSGRVTDLFIREGTSIQKGALLVKLFDGDLQAQVKKQEAQLAIAEKTTERYGQLLKIGGISQQEYDLSNLEIANIKADIGLLKTDIARTEIRAPYSGKIGLRNISLGAYVTPQTVIATIQQVDRLKLEFTVPEIYAGYVRTGQAVNFTLEGYERNFTANIMASEAAITTDSRSLRIRATVQQHDAHLTPGSFARVAFHLGQNKEALLVPSQAIIPQARNKEVILYKGGIAKFVEVTTDVRDSAMVQITHGVKAGDTIVTTGLLAIKPDAPIELAAISND